MRLRELEPEFVRYEDHIETYQTVGREVTGPRQYIIRVYSIAEAQGIWFLCPKCFTRNKGVMGTHMCQVTFAGKGVADHHGSHGTDDQPTRWQFSGTGFDDLTTTPSILLIGGCAWHGFITNGNIIE